MKTLRLLLPLAVFLIIVAFLWVGLYRDPREVPSPLVDKPAPAFTLAQLHEPGKKLSTDDMKGQVWLLNVWASWCVSCRVEHPLLVELARANVVPVIGLNYKDRNELGKQWLAQNGDPYKLSVVDADGRVGIDWGVYGVPETFVIDKNGIDPLQADRSAHDRGARAEDPAARPATAKSMKRILLTTLLSAALVLPAAAFAQSSDPALDARLKKLEEELRCLVCQNQSLADSSAPLAEDLRREVRGLAQQGKNDEQIKDYLVARYGDFVLYNPPVKATTWLLWFGPFVLLLGGGAIWALVLEASRPRGLRRRRRRPPPMPRPSRPASRRRASCSTIRARDAVARGVRHSLPDSLDSPVARASSTGRGHAFVARSGSTTACRSTR